MLNNLELDPASELDCSLSSHWWGGEMRKGGQAGMVGEGGQAWGAEGGGAPSEEPPLHYS